MHVKLPTLCWDILELLSTTDLVDSDNIRSELPVDTSKEQYRYAIKRLERLNLVRSKPTLGTMNMKSYHLVMIQDIDLSVFISPIKELIIQILSKPAVMVSA